MMKSQISSHYSSDNNRYLAERMANSMASAWHRLTNRASGDEVNEVFSQLPQRMQDAFKRQDLALLDAALAELTPEDREKNIGLCVKSGLWIPTPTKWAEDEAKAAVTQMATQVAKHADQAAKDAAMRQNELAVQQEREMVGEQKRLNERAEKHTEFWVRKTMFNLSSPLTAAGTT